MTGGCVMKARANLEPGSLMLLKKKDGQGAWTLMFVYNDNFENQRGFTDTYDFNYGFKDDTRIRFMILEDFVFHNNLGKKGYIHLYKVWSFDARKVLVADIRWFHKNFKKMVI